ncbi:MAG: lipoprotein NlpD [Gammaproteobacteria bacterium]
MLIAVLATGCIANQGQGIRHAGHGWYTVKSTDTLYSIAWRYGLDYKELAHWNQISDEYIINLGQRLIMHEPDNLPAVQVAVATPTINQSMAIPATPEPVKPPDNSEPPARWLWPVKGEVLNSFSLKQLDRRGIDIAGTLGQPIRASAAGRVVYSGNGLAGYGNLIIIKHNDNYLSAYAYCKERLVSEGATIQAGSIIAKMGRLKSKSARLHFQIRKNGKPVDPIKYLTKN